MTTFAESHGLSQNLINWYSREKRNLPWRQSKNPYRIWLSEIILQQTRVAQGLPYFEKFTHEYPTVHDLANADESRVLRTWQGLGYYSRARNLHKTAKVVSKEFHGDFPNHYEGLIKLPGVGPYTAAAIASLAFDEAVPVLDGNVYRLMARLYGLKHDIANQSNRKYFIEILEQLVPKNQPGDFNQAMMEMGALVCTPRNPKCDLCPVRESCFAYEHKQQDQLPVKLKKIKVTHKRFHYVIFEHAGTFGLKERVGSGIWQGLYDFLLIEGDTFRPDDKWGEIETSPVFKHILTHQKIEAKFYLVRLQDKDLFHSSLNKYGLAPYTFAQMLNLPKPKLLVNYIEQQNFSTFQ